MFRKTKKQYPENFKTIFGFSTMSWSFSSAGTFMSTFFMLFLTDYSGIDTVLGAAGTAAAFGTILLLIARIVDIVDDPLQAWIIDSSKPGRFGKYRKFNLLHILAVTIAMIALFGIPGFAKTNPVILCIWLGFFYLMYEFGQALYTYQPLLQNVTYDNGIRTKITKYFRFWQIISVIPVYFFIPIVTSLNKSVGNIGKSFSLLSIILMVLFGIISLFGTSCITEKTDTYTKQGNDGMISIKAITKMIRNNKPLKITLSGMAVWGFVWSLISAIGIYFLKWYYCADWSTGAVNADKYAGIYSIYALASIIPNFVSPFIAHSLVKKSGSIIKAFKIGVLGGLFISLLMFVAFITGILKVSPFVFIGIYFLMGFSFGTAVIPQLLLWTESADYAEYKEGRKMTAIVNSINSILTKAQTAITTSLTGFILVLVGYSVNASTGTYAGDLLGIPKMISGFGIFVSLVPAILCLITYLIFSKYPLTPEEQKEIYTELSARHAQNQINREAL